MNTNFIAGAPDVVGARSDHVRRRTASHVNEEIDSLTQVRMEAALSGGREAVIRRLHRLDRELNVDRVLMAYFAIIGSASLGIGRRSSAWGLLVRAQTAFLLMQSFIGWSPPLILFRAMGFRTAREIAAERAALVDKLAGWN